MSKSASSPAISFNNVTLGYNRHPAVHHLDAELAQGSLTAIVGPNGAGKSTLLKGISGHLRVLEGRITVAETKRSIAYLPQVAALDRSFPLNVYDLVATGLWPHLGLLGRLRKNDLHRIEEAIAAVGLTGFEGRALGTLSGGQMQRTLFARLLLQDAQLILLDEPFTAIDSGTTADLLDLVRRWHGEARTIIAVLHDMDVVRRIFPQTLLLAREKVAFGRTEEVLVPENLLKARRMIEAFDDNAPFCSRNAA